MNKIESFVLYRLSNSTHQVFMTNIRELAVRLSPNKLNIDEAFVKYCAAVENVDKATRGKRGSTITHDLLQLDRQRLKTWSAISGRLKNTLACPIEHESKAAEALLYAVKRAKKVRTMNYIEKSAALRIVCQKLLDTEHAPLCEQLALKHWVEALQNQNNYFDERQRKRSRENAYKDAGKVTDARLRLDAAYTKITKRINASVDLGLTNPASADLKSVLQLQAENTFSFPLEMHTDYKSARAESIPPS